MIKRSEFVFHYPSNLHQFDLATLVSLYRSRGEPVRAPVGELFGCPVTHRLMKEAKRWFGITYSQHAWDQLLTKDAKGYPLTEVEMNVMGLAVGYPGLPNTRDFIERNSGSTSQLVFMVINDLRAFGFVDEDEAGVVTLSADGEDALNGIARRIYEKKFLPDMLLVNQKRVMAPAPDPSAKKEGPQIDLF